MVVAACGRSPSPPAPPSDTTTPRSPLLAAVGPEPRGFADLSLTQPMIREQITGVATGIAALSGKAVTDCIALADLGHVRIAIGAPLRIAAEIDGKIDARAVACLLGDSAATLAQHGIVVHDRPDGIAIEVHAERPPTAPVLAVELERRCGEASCVVVALGPMARPLWVQLRVDSSLHIELSGPSLGQGAGAFVKAVDRIRAMGPALDQLQAREKAGALVIELPSDPSVVPMVALALALRTHALEVFKIPSVSMVPTLLLDDQIFAAKDAFGPPTLGDLVVYESEGRPYVKRYLAGPGQTISESADGLSIDGKPLVTEVVDASYHYRDRNEVDDQIHERTGTLMREHLGARSYLTLRTGLPRTTDTWTVPAGHMFLVGDNRNNSNDSRYQGPSPSTAIIGRALAVWLALRDGAPDWDRMGVPIE